MLETRPLRNSCRPSSACTTSTLNEVDRAAFLGAVNFGSAWTECVHVNGVPLSMKVDTGADVTAISELEYRRTLRSVPKLQRPDRVLRGPDGKGLPVLGQFQAKLSIPLNSISKSSHQPIYVIHRLRLPLLGLPVIQALHVLKHIDSMPADEYTDLSVFESFPAIFSGLSQFKGRPHQIHLTDDAVPFALTTPRRVPLPMTAHICSELKRMEDLRIIRKVDQPTDWCAGMVVVPKTNGLVRISGDFTCLNEYVRQE